jgi:sortase A
MHDRLRRTLGGLGRTLVTVGLLILLFVAYELWGTGWFTAREQSKLKSDFKAELQARAATTTTSTPPTTTGKRPHTSTTTTPSRPVEDSDIAKILAGIKEGDPIGLMNLPWGQYAVVQGTSRDDLKKGPGHYLNTPYPGQYGNAAIAGHRTTYLHPFQPLATLHVGDTFTVQMLWGTYTYRVMTPPTPVRPHDSYVAATAEPQRPGFDHPDSRPISQAWLTLTTCHPEYSASQRLVVQAELVVAKSPKPVKYVPRPQPKPSSGSGQVAAPAADGLALGGDMSARGPAVLFGLFLAFVGALWWWVYRHWRHPATWLVGLVVFAPVLIGFYVYLERVLPAGY